MSNPVAPQPLLGKQIWVTVDLGVSGGCGCSSVEGDAFLFGVCCIVGGVHGGGQPLLVCHLHEYFELVGGWDDSLCCVRFIWVCSGWGTVADRLERLTCNTEGTGSSLCSVS